MKLYKFSALSEIFVRKKKKKKNCSHFHDVSVIVTILTFRNRKKCTTLRRFHHDSIPNTAYLK